MFDNIEMFQLEINICISPFFLYSEIPYEVTVWTSDLRGAGTDANVFLQMYGELGKTEQYNLRNRTDNFEQGQMDKFKVKLYYVGMKDSYCILM